MDIKSMGVIGSINTDIDVFCLTTLGDNYRISHSQGFLIIEKKVTACIYRSGKIQIYGIKKIEDIQYYWEKTLDLLKVYVNVSKADETPILKFIVASDKLPYRINLRQLAETLINENIEFEPEQFPGLIWKLPRGTCLLFSTGSCVITGSSSPEKAISIFNEIKEKIEYHDLFIEKK